MREVESESSRKGFRVRQQFEACLVYTEIFQFLLIKGILIYLNVFYKIGSFEQVFYM